MNKQSPLVWLAEVLTAVDRTETPQPGTSYRQIGVKLWGEGAYEREPMDGSQTKYARLFRAETDDVIVNKIWARNGSVAVVPPALAGSFGSAEFPMFAPNRRRLEPRWMHWLTKIPTFWAQCDEKSRGTSGKNRIRPERFLEIEIPLPPLAEQRRLVQRIEELAVQIHEARALRHQSAEETDALLSRVADAIFGGELPQVRLDELCSLITDGTHQTPRYVEDGHTFLSAQNVKPFRFMPEQHRKVSIEDYRSCVARAKPQKGDVLLTRVGAGIGEAAVLDRELDFAFYVSLALLRPIPERILPEFLVHWLNAPNGRAQSRGKTLGRGHSQGNLNLKLLREFQLPVPPIPEQRQIVAKLSALQTQLDLLKHLQVETSAELDDLLPAILDRAFKGEI